MVFQDFTDGTVHRIGFAVPLKIRSVKEQGAFEYLKGKTSKVGKDLLRLVQRGFYLEMGGVYGYLFLAFEQMFLKTS